MSCGLGYAQGMLIALIWGAVIGCSPPTGTVAEGIPNLPKPRLEGFSDAARRQVQTAHRKALADPGSADASGRLGAVLQAYDRYEIAEACYRRAQRLAPESFRWTYYLATVQAASGKTDDAVESFRKALELRPEDLPTRLRLADLLSHAGEVERAGEILSRLVETHQKSAGVHYRLGQIHTAKQDLSSAIRHHRRAIELAPGHREAHYALALAYREVGRPEDSKQHLAAYEQSDPNRRRDYADPLIDAVDQLRRGTAQHHLDEGRRYEGAGKTEEALREYQEVLKVDPHYVQAHVNLISVYGKLGNFEEAERHYRESVKINPNVEEGHYNYGVLLSLQDRYREATKAFEWALEINPLSADTHNNLGFALEQAGRTREAPRHYRLALENQPNHRLAHYHLGRHLAAGGAYEEAINHLQKALFPEDERTPRFLYLLAQVYAQGGHPDQASDALRRAKELAATFGQNDVVAAIERSEER